MQVNETVPLSFDTSDVVEGTLNMRSNSSSLYVSVPLDFCFFSSQSGRRLISSSGPFRLSANRARIYPCVSEVVDPRVSSLVSRPELRSRDVFLLSRSTPAGGSPPFPPSGALVGPHGASPVPGISSRSGWGVKCLVRRLRVSPPH